MKKRISIPYIITVTVLILLVFIGAVFVQPEISESGSLIIFILSSTVLVLSAIVNAVYMNYRKKHPHEAKDEYRKMKALVNGGEKTLPILKKRLKRMQFITDLYTTMIILSVVCFSLFISKVPGLAILSLYLIHDIVVRFDIPSQGNGEEMLVMHRVDYPELYELAQKAQNEVGISKPIKISCDSDMNACVRVNKDCIDIVLGALLIKSLSKEELYQVLIHEFAHAKDRKHIGRGIRDLRRYNTTEGDTKYQILFQIVDEYEFRLYRYFEVFASIEEEKNADAVVYRIGEPQIYANALTKIFFYELYDKMYIRTEKCMFFYATEEMPEDFGSEIYKDFRKACELNKELGFKILFNQLKPRVSSHPIVRERIASLGVENVGIVFPDENSRWSDTGNKAIQQINRNTAVNCKEKYNEVRQNEYLPMLNAYDDWVKSGSPLTYEATRDVFDSLLSLYRFDDVVLISQKMKLSGVSRNECSYAIFCEGIARLKLFDNRGIDCLYEAIRLNRYCVDSASRYIADYCFYMGLDDELERYRQFIDSNGERFVDEYEASYVNENDNLSPCDLPIELFERNLEFIVDVCDDILNRIFIVKKTVTQEIYTHFYILDFAPGTQDEYNEMINKVFMYLDKQEENYCLLVFNEITNNGWIEDNEEYCAFDRSGK